MNITEDNLLMYFYCNNNSDLLFKCTKKNTTLNNL